MPQGHSRRHHVLLGGLAERPKLSDGGHETARLKPRRDAAVRWSAWLGGTVELKTKMKELLTISSNFMASWTEDKKLLPQVEVILVMSEPSYTVDAVGEVVRQRETSQCRFSASPKVLYRLAEAMTKLAAEAEGLVPPNTDSQTGGRISKPANH